jgi:hypothetical protein
MSRAYKADPSFHLNSKASILDFSLQTGTELIIKVSENLHTNPSFFP